MQETDLGEMDLKQDVGPSVCEEIRLAMTTTEPEWFERSERGYRWWPHRFMQRVEARPAVESYGVSISRVEFETELLEGVAATPENLLTIANLNKTVSMHGLVLDDKTGRLSLYCSVTAHKQNKDVAVVLAKHAVSMQAACANRVRGDLQGMLGGQLIEVELPGGGLRESPDEMLSVIELFHVPLADEPSLFEENEECLRAEREVGAVVSLMTNASASGLTAEFAWGQGESMPAFFQAALRRAGGEPAAPSTALFQMMPGMRHPSRIGNGMLCLLTLPVDIDGVDGPLHANALNLWERSQVTFPHQIGAWTYRDRSLSHVSFLSNFCWFPGIGSVMMQAAALRTATLSGLMT